MRISFLYLVLFSISLVSLFIPLKIEYILIKYNPFNYINDYRLSIYAFSKDAISDYIDLINIRRENSLLKKKLAYYETFKNELSKCQNESRQLYYISNTLSFINPKANPSIYITKVVGYDLSGKRSFIEIENNGNIKEGDIVSSNGYFLGIVSKSYKNMAFVITVYNKKFHALVYDYATGDTYIYKGGYPYGSIINASSSDNINVGDLIYFRSLKNQEIPYLLVGKVKSVNRAKNLFFLKVSVRPLANPNIYDFVVVIDNKTGTQNE